MRLSSLMQQDPANYLRNNDTGATYDLGPSQNVQGSPQMPALDYSSAPVEIGGYGKGYRLKGDPMTVVLADGRMVRMGEDTGAAQQRIKSGLDLQKMRSDIAHTNASTIKLGQHESTVPVGYRQTQTGLEPIPGGPADFKQQGAYNADTATMQSSQADLDRLATSANELLKHPGLSRITGIVGAFPSIPGTDAADAQAKLATLKSQVGFGVLQAMRNASKTGGALGNVSDAEGKRLEANLAALENAQSEKQFRESLKKIIEFSNGAKDRLAGAYNLKYSTKGQAAQGPGVSAQPANAQPGRTVTLQDIMDTAKSTGKDPNQIIKDVKAKGYTIGGM